MNKYVAKFATVSLAALAWTSTAQAQGQEYDHLTPRPGSPRTEVNVGADADARAAAAAHANGTVVQHGQQHLNQDGRFNQTGIIAPDIDARGVGSVDTSVKTVVEGAGPVTQNGGAQNVNIGGDSFQAGAITGAPVVYGPSNLSNCADGFAISVGGGNPFTGSGGIGLTFTNSEGAPIALSAFELLEMPIEERTRYIDEAKLSENQFERLQCGMNAAYPAFLAHKQRLVEQGVGVLINGDEAWQRAAGHGVIANKDDDYRGGLTDTLRAKQELMQGGNRNASDADLLQQMLLGND